MSGEPPDRERSAGPADASAPETVARAARAAQRRLGSAPPALRSAALQRLAGLLESRRDRLITANATDLARAQREGLSGVLLNRLKLDAARLDSLAEGVRQLAGAPDPLGRVLSATLLDEGLELTRVSHPLGVLLVIFESRPDAVIQIGSLAIRTGNAVILKGGREASASNRALADCLRDALAGAAPAGATGGPAPADNQAAPAPVTGDGARPGPADAVQLVEGRAAVAGLLALDGEIDLVIPRGSGALVRHIQASTRIPVLGHAEGICHIYLDAAADAAMAARIVLDAKCAYPSACNAVETLLVHHRWLPQLPALLEALSRQGVRLRGDERIRSLAPGVEAAQEEDWDREYGELILAVRCVDGLDEAIDHIHRHGSGHTDAVVTADPAVAERFLREVDSASVFVNASTRFADGFRYGLGAEVGISTSRLHARGPVGMEGLLTTRWLLRGRGQAAGDYGPGGRAFLHRTLPPE